MKFAVLALATAAILATANDVNPLTGQPLKHLAQGQTCQGIPRPLECEEYAECYFHPAVFPKAFNSPEKQEMDMSFYLWEFANNCVDIINFDPPSSEAHGRTYIVLAGRTAIVIGQEGYR